jgi:excisionase family DNA binding protein
MGIPNLLTVDEFAEWTRLSGSTIRRKCASGEIVSYRFGERIRIPAPELPEFLAKNVSGGASDDDVAETDSTAIKKVR